MSFAGSAHAWNFDTSNKVGSSYFGSGGYHDSCAMDTGANTLHCFCTADGSQHSSVATATMYSNSGVYLIPDYTGGLDINYAFEIENVGGMPSHDSVVSYYIDNDGGAACTVSGGNQYTPPFSLMERLGPRAGVALDQANGVNGPNLWLFTVVNNNSSSNHGHLLSLEIGTHGTAASGTWTDVSGSVGVSFDGANAPIAGARSAAFSGHPIVAVRKSSTVLALAYLDAGNNWHELETGALTTTTIGNSIAISTTPAVTHSGGSADYEWIAVSGNDGNLYETRFSKTAAGTYFLTSWASHTISSTLSVDATTDSLAASWYSTSSGDWQTIYTRVVDNTGGHYDYSVDLAASNGAVASSGWELMNTSGSGWSTSYNFAGEQSVFRYPGSGGAIDNEAYALCTDTAMNTTTICEVFRTENNTNFAWSYF